MGDAASGLAILTELPRIRPPLQAERLITSVKSYVPVCGFWGAGHVERVVEQIAIGIVAGPVPSDQVLIVSGSRVSRLPRNAAALADVAERIVTESLRPDTGRAAIAANPLQIVVSVGAGLIVLSVKWIGDAQC